VSLINDIFKQLDENRGSDNQAQTGKLCGNKLCIDFGDEKRGKRAWLFIVPVIILFIAILFLVFHFIFPAGKNKTHSFIKSHKVRSQSTHIVSNDLKNNKEILKATAQLKPTLLPLMKQPLPKPSTHIKSRVKQTPSLYSAFQASAAAGVSSSVLKSINSNAADSNVKKQGKMVIRPAVVVHASGHSLQSIKALSHSCLHCAISELESMDSIDINYVRLLAELYVKNSDWVASDQYMSFVLQRYPDDVVLKQLYGRSLVERKQVKKAITVLLQLKPSISRYPGYYNLIGVAYFQEGYYDIAERYFSRLTAIYPNVARYWAQEGFSLNAQRKYLDAMKALQKAVQIGGMSPELMNTVQHELGILSKSLVLTD
jgi:tetratricopeptide (TPR) repeat protein